MHNTNINLSKTSQDGDNDNNNGDKGEGLTIYDGDDALYFNGIDAGEEEV